MLTIDNGYLAFNRLTLRRFVKKFKDIAGINSVKDLTDENIDKAISEAKDERDVALINKIVIVMEMMNSTDVVKVREEVNNEIEDLLDELMEFHCSYDQVDDYVTSMFPFVSAVLIDQAIKKCFGKSASELQDKDLGRYKSLDDMLYDLYDSVESNQQDYSTYKNDIRYLLRDSVLVNDPSTDYLDVYFENGILEKLRDKAEHERFSISVTIMERMKNKIKRATEDKESKKISKTERKEGILNILNKVDNNELKQSECNDSMYELSKEEASLFSRTVPSRLKEICKGYDRELLWLFGHIHNWRPDKSLYDAGTDRDNDKIRSKLLSIVPSEEVLNNRDILFPRGLKCALDEDGLKKYLYPTQLKLIRKEVPHKTIEEKIQMHQMLSKNIEGYYEIFDDNTTVEHIAKELQYSWGFETNKDGLIEVLIKYHTINHRDFIILLSDHLVNNKINENDTRIIIDTIKNDLGRSKINEFVDQYEDLKDEYDDDIGSPIRKRHYNKEQEIVDMLLEE